MLQIIRCVQLMNPSSDEDCMLNLFKTLFDKKLKLVNSVYNMYVLIPTRPKFAAYIFCNHNLVKCFNNLRNLGFTHQKTVIIM